MADITKVMVVEIGNIAKLGPKEKSAVAKLGSIVVPDAGPTCTTIVFGYGSKNANTACTHYASDETAEYYHDESTGKMYSDSCGGNEASEGYYANGDGYRFYNVSTSTLGEVIGACRP